MRTMRTPRVLAIYFPGPVEPHSQMNTTAPIGRVAAALVLATSCMRAAGKLRCIAIASTPASIANAVLANLGPIHHRQLLPIDVAGVRPLRRVPQEHAEDGRPPVSTILASSRQIHSMVGQASE